MLQYTAGISIIQDVPRGGCPEFTPRVCVRACVRACIK